MKRNIRNIVKEGYQKGDYVGYFRSNSQPDGIQKKFLDYLTAHLLDGSKILDMGCGIAVPFDKYLADRGFKITGVDFTHKHIEQARKNLPAATFIEGDFSKMDFGGERFHAIVALYSVFHSPREEQQELLNRMHAVLEHEGVILMTLATVAGQSIEENWTGAPMAWSSYDPATYKAMIAKAGFDIIESEYEGRPGEDEYHWWVLAKKN